MPLKTNVNMHTAQPKQLATGQNKKYYPRLPSFLQLESHSANAALLNETQVCQAHQHFNIVTENQTLHKSNVKM